MRLLVRFVRFKRIGYYRRVNSFCKRIFTIDMWKTLMQSQISVGSTPSVDRILQRSTHGVDISSNGFKTRHFAISSGCDEIF